MFPQLSPMVVAHGLVPALMGPVWVTQVRVWYPNMALLPQMSPLQAPMAVAQGLVSALKGLMGVAQEVS